MRALEGWSIGVTADRRAAVGLAGSKVRIRGVTTDGYHVYLGADLAEGVVGEVVGRVTEDDLASAITAIVGLWEALRHPGETLSATVRRVGVDAVGQLLEAAMDDHFALGAEPDTTAVSIH